MISISHARNGLIALMFAAAISLAFAVTIPAHAATNLITNASLEASTTNPALPDHWSQGFFGTNTVSYGYGTAFGHTGKGINVTITTYVADDAKWVFDSVPVTASAVYSFSDWYKSSATSYLVAQFTLSDNTVVYSQVATLPAAASWTQTTQTIIAPANATSASVFHVLRSTGNLATDDYSLSLADSSQTQFDSGIVSLTFDDGWTSQYQNAFPLLGNLKATFYIIGKALKGALIVDLFKDANAFPPESAASTVATSTGVVWGTIYPDPTLHSYEFSDIYSASSTNSVIVTYSTGNHTATSSPTFTFPAGTNLTAKFTLDLPVQPDAGISIRHTSSGKLSVSAKSLVADATGYMTQTMIHDLATAGNEIGNHTESHCNLVFLSNGQSSTDSNVCAFNDQSGLTYQSEIDNGSTTLKSFGFTTLNFAYPNGATNDAIKQYLAGKGYASARTVDEGLNTKQADRMALKVEVVDKNATFNQVKGWIDSAALNKLWLILVFHQIDDPALISSNGEDGGTTPAVFAQIADYLKNKTDVQVKTVAQALGLLTTTPPADTTAPVIAAHADVMATATSTSSVGAMVTYTAPTATDNVDASVTVGCVPASGSLFAIGSTTVTCSAHDTANNAATPTTFVVGVRAATIVPPADTQAPVIAAHADVFAATTSTSGEFVAYTTPTATDNVDASVTVSCTPISGSLFAIGSSTVTCVAHDAANNHATTTFAIGVMQTATTPVDPTCSATQHLDNHVCVDNPVTQPTGGGSSSGSGGGSGGGIVSGPFSIGYVNTSPTALSLPGAVLGASTNCYVFNSTLQVGSTGADVSALQSRLMVEGFFTASATGYFGSITKAAVMTFQAKNGVDSVGIVGPKTRALLNATCPTGAPGATNQPAPAAPSAASFTQTLGVGSIGAEVTLLQKVLIDLAFLKVAAPTGYFGALTKAAVMGYQTSRAIPSTGLVGPLTRAALNSNAGAVK